MTDPKQKVCGATSSPFFPWTAEEPCKNERPCLRHDINPQQAEDSEWKKEMLEKFKIWGLDWPWANYIRDLLAQARREELEWVWQNMSGGTTEKQLKKLIDRLEALKSQDHE